MASHTPEPFLTWREAAGLDARMQLSNDAGSFIPDCHPLMNIYELQAEGNSLLRVMSEGETSGINGSSVVVVAVIVVVIRRRRRKK